jgi:predicted HTH domain antitoxin
MDNCAAAGSAVYLISMKVEFELPPGLDGKVVDAATRAAREAAALQLYSAGAVSAGRASELVGIPLRQFLRLASERGIPVFDAAAEELDDDVRSALGARPQAS